MPKRYRPREVVRILESFDWRVTSRHGSHVRFTKAGMRTHVTVAISQREIPRGTLRNIIRQAGLTPRQFEERGDDLL
ncbi:MAG: type II toxin-antitoxin system HicA family toxin [SAR202 cluster bacterium]|nr:hypothetical protein [Chloroflexota bacterium]MQG57282.1 type II toxin-antitoxin system HicA family toxin [SAR202 cluster bacterium]MQG68391.1 type II toxin-antitoxin system HicA family toxin [SAR202 cluster bacterium]HAL49629.1 type II toxin-antitoxin system HicA family toxin [Dehalococcoidia bacterium]